MAKKKTTKKKPANRKRSSKSKLANARTLTQADHEKIQRLLGTAELGKVRLAIELTEETCSDTEFKDIFTDEIILSLVSSGDIELFAITASFFLRHDEHWDRFLRCANNTSVLTGVAVKHKDTSLRQYTAITVKAAAMLSTSDRWDTALDGLTQLSVEVARNLAGAPSLSLRGILSLPDDIAAALAEHKDELDLSRLTELSDAAAKSLGKHQGTSLNLDGLTELSDDASASISQHRGELSLDGLSGLSPAAAKSFGRFKGSELRLKSLTTIENLSDEEAIALDNKLLQLPSQITKKISAIIKKVATADSLLTQEQQSKVRKLIKTCDSDNLAMACELLTAAAASEGDWIKLFPKSRIRELLNTWEPGIWNTLVPAMKGFPRVAEQLSIQAAKRLNTFPTQWEICNRIEASRGDILMNANDDVIELIGANREYRLAIDAEELSDDQAATLAKYKGEIGLSHLRKLSDTAARSLAKKKPKLKGWFINLDNLPKSAAKILRDAGHG